MKTLDAQIESILFFKASPMSFKDLSNILGVSISDIETAIETLDKKLVDRGISLVMKDNSVTMGTDPEMSEVIDTMRKEDLEKDLGKSGMETLTIILYRSPITRTQIDYIRGVNSTFTLRTLLIRGLVERVINPEDQRSYQYRPTLELLKHLGIQKQADMPEYESIQKEIDIFEGVEEKREEELENNDAREQ
jgi:segregation and condensation protein B